MPSDSTIIEHYFPELTAKQKQQFQQLGELYPFWNAQINVVSRKDIDNMYEHHVLHSLGIAKVITFEKGTSILDVGTGGGFPGIPLAILFPEVQFHLVDSIGKKIKVVNEVAQAIGLENVTAAHERAENVNGHFDFIVSRAVTALPKFLPWVRKKVKKRSSNTLNNGILYLKGGDLHEELNSLNLKNKPSIFGLDDYFEEEFFATKKVVYIPL
jgi:16S rRNA (guanine527-N7)-methyltransferase